MTADGLRRQEQQRQEQAGALESAVAVLNSSIAHNDESARRIRADLQQQEGREDSLAAQIAQRKDRLEEIEGQLSAGSQAIQVQREKVEENAKSAGQLEQELERLRDSQALAQADAADARALRSALAAAAQEVLDRTGPSAGSWQSWRSSLPMPKPSWPRPRESRTRQSSPWTRGATPPRAMPCWRRSAGRRRRAAKRHT